MVGTCRTRVPLMTLSLRKCAHVCWTALGLIVLHSAHYSKPFTGLMGTSCSLKWREAAEKERLWVIEHGHPIVEGLGEYFEIEHAEM